MKLFTRIFSVCLGMLLMCATVGSAFAAVNVNNMRVGNQTNGARVVFDMDKSINYRVFLLKEPRRVVIDLADANIGKIMTKVSNQVIANSRIGVMSGNDKRVVMDLSRPAIVKKAFLIPPQSGQNWRLVVDLEMSSPQNFDARIGNKYMLSNSSKFNPQEQVQEQYYAPKQKNTQPVSKITRKRVIVLDPGHGGKDPGAIGGYAKTYEKNVTLAMGKELKQMLKNKGYTVYLTRETDIFIPLRQRIKIAQRYNADLFMSIHADSAQNRNATGLSVYTLSDTASDKEAAALAERENKSDIIGGIDLGGNTKEVNDILISLSQTDTRNKSSKFATYLVQEMGKNVKLVRNTHRFAGFAVLKAPDVPAALLEMGYLSNRSEESNLRTAAYRKKLAEAVVKAIDRYFADPEIASN
ncbi:MAG: N-acetylmuramoyl-L-alanine amidase [Alphaproteobacteria bacterium]|nr:N-acetylmuramoyl-L-alanine amidase [Alphaproteobacteria bacterium]